MTKNKRLKIVLTALTINFLTVWAGMHFGTDLIALGTCLMMINSPLFVYILGETYRPSKEEKDV